MDVTADNFQPVTPKLVSHDLPTIGILNENYGIWIPYISAIRRTTNNTHRSASVHVIGQGTVFGEALVDYR